MNIKQQAIEAMHRADMAGANYERMLDAALAVLADPEKWTDEMDAEVTKADWMTGHGPFAAVINHVKGLPT